MADLTQMTKEIAGALDKAGHALSEDQYVLLSGALAFYQDAFLSEFKRLRTLNEKAISGAITKEHADICAKFAGEICDLTALLKEAADYLDTHKETSIGHGSILHRKFREASELPV